MPDCWVATLLEPRRGKVPPGLLACGKPGTDDGRMTRHHLIKQQRLRSEWPTVERTVDRLLADLPHRTTVEPPAWVDALPRTIDDLLGAEALMVWCCWRHHQLVENKRVVVWFEDLPEEAVDFAAWIGLGGWLARYYAVSPVSWGAA